MGGGGGDGGEPKDRVLFINASKQEDALRLHKGKMCISYRICADNMLTASGYSVLVETAIDAVHIRLNGCFHKYRIPRG